MALTSATVLVQARYDYEELCKYPATVWCFLIILLELKAWLYVTACSFPLAVYRITSEAFSFAPFGEVGSFISTTDRRLSTASFVQVST